MSIEPDMSQESQTETQPESGAEGAATGAQQETQGSEPGAKPTIQEILELDKHERFKLDGKEITLKDLRAERLRQSDYSRKTQEIAEERKYYDNLSADLEKVRSNPALAQAFKQVYPDKFHYLLGYLAKSGEAEPSGNAPVDSDSDKRFKSILEPIQKELGEYKSILSTYQEERVAATQAKLEAQDAKLSAKYPLADIEAVYARAQAEHKKGTELTEEKWDEFWKLDNERHQKRYSEHYGKQVKSQKEAISKAKDMAPGGGTPGRSPARVKLKDVADSILSERSG